MQAIANNDAAIHQGAAPPAPALSLRHHAARGLAWTLMQTVGSKLIAVAGQAALAWFLDKEDFGLIALTTTAAAFAGFIQQTGLREVLVQRQSRFGKWVNPAFWIAAGFGILGALLIAAAAPLAAIAFHSPKLIGLLLVMALAAPFDAIAVIPLARLQGQLRFGFLARVALSMACLSTGLSVVLAWKGFGAYSFVLPRPIIAVAQAAIYWWASGVQIRPTPQLRRWRYVLGDSGVIMATAIFTIILGQGDYLVMGLLRPKAVVGVYYFAFSLSTQAAQLVAFNLAAVLFPTLSRLDTDQARQTQACIRASRLLALVGVPLCLLQAAVAGPLIRLVYHEKWIDAIAPFQALSVGMAMVVLSTSATSLIQAQRRFRFLFLWNATLSLFFILTVGAGAWLGGALSVAIAVSTFYAIFGPMGLYVSIRPGGGTWRDVVDIYARPICFGAASVGLALLLPRVVPMLRDHLVANGLCVAVSMALIYISFAVLWAKRDVREVAGLLTPLLAGRGRGRG